MLQLEIRKAVNRYLSNELDWPEFLSWFYGETWEVEHSDDEEAKRLTSEIELLHAEFSNGDLSESELKEELNRLISVLALHYLPGECSATVMESSARNYEINHQRLPQAARGALSGLEIDRQNAELSSGSLSLKFPVAA